MFIRNYQPGDDQAQARVYNAAAAHLPSFKPAGADEVARRYQDDSDPEARFYAVVNDEVVGYCLFCPNGRVSYAWCLPGAEMVREPLMDAVLDGMQRRGLGEAWAAYRSDWSAILRYFESRGFHEKRQMINYLADAATLPEPADVPDDRIIQPLARAEFGELASLSPGLFSSIEPHSLEAFFWENPHFDFSESLFALRERRTGRILGASLLVLSERFADPSKIDAAMPCFRLGTFGTERERHKRVNGLFSCVFLDASEADPLLAAPDWSGARAAGLTHVAAQAPSDAPALCAFYDQHFQRQGAFPIYARRIPG